MLAIKTFSELTSHLQNLRATKKLIAVNPSDEHSLEAIIMAVKMGIIKAHIIGKEQDFNMNLVKENNIAFTHSDNQKEASDMAVKMVKEGKADMLMKGLVNTDVLLHSILNKEFGLVPYGNVISFVAAVETPHYQKLMFITDPAVIPSPNLRQRMAMINYAIETAHNFGINKPKIALLHGTEKMNHKLNFMTDYQAILDKAKEGYFGDIIIDGPLDLFLAVNPELGKIKQVDTPIKGDSDILIFPDLDAANIFYKSMVTFAHAKIGGITHGTEKPVILTSRSDSVETKFNSIALACLT
ncbi:phosphate acyltransferase [Paludibacter sp.]